MIENIKLDSFTKEAGVYLFKVNEEVIYVGSSKNLYRRMTFHRSCIKQGSDHGYKQDLYECLQINPFTVEFQLTNDYRQLEQELVEKYNPRYNTNRANTGLGASKGRKVEYYKEWYQKYKDEVSEKKKQYYEDHKQKKKQYYNQLCCFNNETITLCALRERFKRLGIPHSTLEAKKYLIGGNDD